MKQTDTMITQWANEYEALRAFVEAEAMQTFAVVISKDGKTYKEHLQIEMCADLFDLSYELEQIICDLLDFDVIDRDSEKVNGEYVPAFTLYGADDYGQSAYADIDRDNEIIRLIFQ